MAKTATKPTKLVHGIGVNDADYFVRRKIGNPRSMCQFYGVWSRMMRRCYCDKFKSENQTYIGCSVIEEWHSFMNFRSWMMFQDWKGKQLDKDIISPCNKVYGPNLCAFVNQRVNLLLVNNSAVRGKYPQGVSFDKDRNSFSARCRAEGKTHHLGRFQTPESALKAYKEFKSSYVIKVANEQDDLRIKNGLLKHAEIIMSLS